MMEPPNASYPGRKRVASQYEMRKSKRVRRESARLRQIKEEGTLELSDSDVEQTAETKQSQSYPPVGPHEKVKGVSYNHKSKLWGASWYENGKRIDKAFSISRYGAATARAKAIQWRRDRELGIPYQKPAVKGTCSQVRGVHFDQRNKQWKASWSINGRRFEKTFSVSKYGDSEAKRMAIQWRRDREAGLPYEKPKRTCEVRGVWYMRWSKTWVASWSENGRWVRKSFSVSKYGERGARQRAIECRSSHTQRPRKKKENKKSIVNKDPGTPDTSVPEPEKMSPRLALKLDQTVRLEEKEKKLAFPSSFQSAGNAAPNANGSTKSFQLSVRAGGAVRPKFEKHFPITPRSKKAIYQGAEALVSLLSSAKQEQRTS